MCPFGMMLLTQHYTSLNIFTIIFILIKQEPHYFQQRSQKESKKKMIRLIFVFIKEKVFLAWVIRPNVFNTLINFSFIFKFLKIFYHFNRCARANCIINQF